jgi:hypothetical protein
LIVNIIIITTHKEQNKNAEQTLHSCLRRVELTKVSSCIKSFVLHFIIHAADSSMVERKKKKSGSGGRGVQGSRYDNMFVGGRGYRTQAILHITY